MHFRIIQLLISFIIVTISCKPVKFDKRSHRNRADFAGGAPTLAIFLELVDTFPNDDKAEGNFFNLLGKSRLLSPLANTEKPEGYCLAYNHTKVSIDFNLGDDSKVQKSKLGKVIYLKSQNANRCRSLFHEQFPEIFKTQLNQIAVGFFHSNLTKSQKSATFQ